MKSDENPKRGAQPSDFTQEVRAMLFRDLLVFDIPLGQSVLTLQRRLARENERNTEGRFYKSFVYERQLWIARVK